MAVLSELSVSSVHNRTCTVIWYSKQKQPWLTF